MLRRIFLPMACLLLVSCASRLSHATKDVQLAAERTRLARMKDPADKTRSYIRISGFLLDLTTNAAPDGDTQRLLALLTEYTDAIRAARTTIVASGRDPDRGVSGYRDLEIALRTQTRTLKDLDTLLSVDSREPVDKALEAATTI